MTNHEIDEIVVPASAGMERVRMEEIARMLAVDPRPVRPVASAWARVSWLVVVCAAISVAAAAVVGLRGAERLGMGRIVAIFSVLGLLTVVAAMVSVSAMTPGSRRWADPRVVLAGATLAVAGVFALLFGDYGMHRFVPQGLVCLRNGMLVAVIAGPGIWMVLRRGFAVNAAMAGLAAGTVAGLAGVMMLELHCPNFHAWHVMVWHSAVIVAGGGLGAVWGRVVGRR